MIKKGYDDLRFPINLATPLLKSKESEILLSFSLRHRCSPSIWYIYSLFRNNFYDKTLLERLKERVEELQTFQRIPKNEQILDRTS